MLSKYPHLAALAHEGISEEQSQLALFRIGVIQKLRKQQVGRDGNISGIHSEAAILTGIFNIGGNISGIGRTDVNDGTKGPERLFFFFHR